nr:FAD/NAD(P)-binding protein [Kribbella speibonae]
MIVVVGAGPRGAGIVERLIANVAELLGGRTLEIHVVDPYSPGSGRIWRQNQSALMWLNVPLQSVTMFTDSSVDCDGAIRPGLSLHSWTARHGGDVHSHDGFVSRLTQGRYLEWFFESVVAQRPTTVTVVVHTTRAVELLDHHGGRQQVRLANGEPDVTADAVILAMGHLDVLPDHQAFGFAEFASRHRLSYIPSGYSADLDLGMVRPAEDVLIRGMGLAFVDLTVLLTEGRGGRYQTTAGGLRYVRSGAEPTIYATSRRGVPHRTKFTYVLDDPAALPRFLDAENYTGSTSWAVDFVHDVWPAVAKEIGWSYYHEFFRAHPKRVRTGWNDFARLYSADPWGSETLSRHIAAAVPNPADRWDLDSVRDPLARAGRASLERLQPYVRSLLRADLTRRTSSGQSAELGAFLGFRSAAHQISELLGNDRLTARSEAAIGARWRRLYEHFCSGPPPLRTRQLLALSEAGVLKFLGSKVSVVADETERVFSATSATMPSALRFTALVDGWIPRFDLRLTTDKLLTRLIAAGEATEFVRSDADGFAYRTGLIQVSGETFEMIDRRGAAHRHRYAIGPFTSTRQFSTFTSPGTNGRSFRQNDRLARGVLRTLEAG